MDDFLASVQGLEPGEKVELFELDLNGAGYDVKIYWTPSRQDGLTLKWRGKDYVSRPIMFSGSKKSAQDKPSEPTLSVSNIDTGGYSLLEQYNELLGAKMTRWTTFTKFLDTFLDGTVNPNANGLATYLPEIWLIEQLSDSDPTVIQWRLKSPLDFRDKQLPGRRAYSGICTRNYRVWNGTSFDYPAVKACPYAGSTYFKRDGTTTLAPALDECTFDLEGCNLRFPGQDLPGWFFPGLRRVG